jgi:hypothetical protein
LNRHGGGNPFVSTTTPVNDSPKGTLLERVMASLPQPQRNTKTVGWLVRGMLLTVWTGSFVGIMAYEYSAWPSGSIFFGPFWFIRYNGIDMSSVLSLLIGLPLLFAFPFKPCLLSFLLFLLGLLLWISLGVLGQGIGC